MDRRLSAEEKRRKEEEAARKAANVPLVGPVGDPFGSGGMTVQRLLPSLLAGGNRAEKYLPQFLSLTIEDG